jgi:hypothetical protein
MSGRRAEKRILTWGTISEVSLLQTYDDGVILLHHLLAHQVIQVGISY